MWGVVHRHGVVLVRVCALGGLVVLGSCGHTDAERVVVGQNAANLAALGENVRTLADVARESARVESEAMVRRARERVAEDLVRLRSTITPSSPTEGELADAGAPWAVGLRKEVDALAARVNAAPVEQRAAVACALADERPGVIDLAVGTPGFTMARVLRDAVDLDGTNEMIEGEPNAAVRAGLLARRDAIVDAYMPARVSVEASAKYRAAVERYLVAVDEQARVAGLHAASMQRAASGPDARQVVLGVIGNQGLREAILDIVSREWGATTAADIRDRLGRADEALRAIGREGR